MFFIPPVGITERLRKFMECLREWVRSFQEVRGRSLPGTGRSQTMLSAAG